VWWCLPVRLIARPAPCAWARARPASCPIACARPARCFRLAARPASCLVAVCIHARACLVVPARPAPVLWRMLVGADASWFLPVRLAALGRVPVGVDARRGIRSGQSYSPPPPPNIRVQPTALSLRFFASSCATACSRSTNSLLGGRRLTLAVSPLV
jgi:hypothetical protein